MQFASTIEMLSSQFFILNFSRCSFVASRDLSLEILNLLLLTYAHYAPLCSYSNHIFLVRILIANLVKLTVAQLQKNFPLLSWIPKVHNRIRKRSATKSSPEPDEFSPHANTAIIASLDHFL